ncbi:PatB family C-S lyase [Parabacteroides sp. OttesenSCG-928-N08]|nr:PatB family C-S lyase [Parabacteroides sp. OttesenSCG-928-N08]
MTKYNFDEVIDRKGTDCVKVDMLKEAFGREDLMPLWVADMDFRTPDFIVEALKERCKHELFGYTFPSDDYYESITNWLLYKYNWKVEREWLHYIPGIVKGIAMALYCFTRPGDKVIIQPPVYHPFRLVPESMEREVVNNPLKLVDGRYEMDFEQLESVIDPQCKVLILCSPHNPGGVVWSKETLAKLAEICVRHNILVISDEIHSEMAYPQFKHHPFATVSEAAASCCITFMAPSKTFNIAGIVTSYTVIPNPELREQFFRYLGAGEMAGGSLFSYEATRAAYTYGAEWLQQMRMYVMENVNFVEKFLNTHIPQIKVYPPQASFLVWLDCRELGLSQRALVTLFTEKAGLALNDGVMFGREGKGFMRLNVGCARSILDKALNALKKAVDTK